MEFYRVKTGSILPLGKQGENLAKQIQFDLSRWISNFGPGTVQLLHQRNGDEAPYPVAVEQEGDWAVWTVTSADTAAAGTGRAELQYYVGDALAKSETWMTKVLPALGPASETPPEAQQGWVDQVVKAGAEASEAADRAEEAAVRQPYPNDETGTWWVWNAESGAYEDTGISYGTGGSGGGVTDHEKLTGRDKADQHPMIAITGLEDALAGKQPTGTYLTEETDPTVPDWAKQPDKPSYTADEVGADPSGTAAARVSEHNTETTAHSDMRLLIQGLTDRLNALADSDDTTLDQLSEIVAYIKSNRDLISSVTTDNVSVSDIVDNLTTNVATAPLSAAQGVALKALIDAITVPDKLPNPNALTFTGAVTGSYDGSSPLEVEIPSGGGGLTVTNAATVGQTIKVSATDENGRPTEWEAVDMGKSAYQYAVEGGYTGTEEAFAEKMAAGSPTVDVYAGQGYSNTKVTFDRLPISFSTPLKYQGWVGNSIVRYKNNYAELVYLRDGHNGSTKNTVCVFFDGYDIARVEQCYFDGEAGYENDIGSICVYEMDGIYYTPKCDTTTMYQSTDLINWTTSSNVVSPTITPWGIWNIDGVLYAGDDKTKNTIYVSSDGGKNWQTITIASSYELSEGAFTSVGDKILCFFGKNWTTSTQTSESGHAEMLVYDGTTWSEPKTTNIICNYGNVAGWFDGKLVHVVAKSRRYHLNNGNTGDGSQLQHYCATPEKALQGEFEFIQRIDRNRGDEEGAIAIDSTSVSICINDDGTGLLVSPVSAQSGIMQHSFYSINALMQTNIANKHENEIANYKNKYLLNGIISSGGAKVKHVLQIANGKLDTYGVAGTDYAQSANITLATDGTYIDASSAYSTVGSVGDGMVCIKPLYDVFAPVLIGYKDGNNGYVWARTAGWGVSVLGVWTSISRSTVHNVLYCVVNDGVPLFYFDSIYGLVKCVPYTWKSVSIANAKGTSSPCVSAQGNNLQFTNLEYYGI